MGRFSLAAAGLFGVVFALCALSGPGRIDIEDGQARYEVGRSLIDHGDLVIRDERVWFPVVTGRDGQRFSGYRFPQELLAAVSIACADLTGPSGWEPRRRFFFSCHGALVAALLALLYAIWFRSRGLPVRSSIGWAGAGIFCTPNWFYSTCTFDDLLGSFFCVMTVVAASKSQTSVMGRLGTWFALALALVTKPPLAAVLLPALAVSDDPDRSPARRVRWLVFCVMALALGYASYKAYDLWKYPPELQTWKANEQAKFHAETWSKTPWIAIGDFLVGAMSGSFWHFPPLVLCLAGLRAVEKRLTIALVGMSLAITAFVSLFTFYKGGVCWGPRYLTPVFATLWLVAPAGAKLIGGRLTLGALLLGSVVQLMGLAIVPERLFVERKLPTGYFYDEPDLCFNPVFAHLPNRLREIVDSLQAPRSIEFSPEPDCTFTMPVFDPPYYNGPKGIEGVRRYAILNSPRPWWVLHWEMPESQRPVAIVATMFLLLGIFSVSLLALGCGVRS